MAHTPDSNLDGIISVLNPFIEAQVEGSTQSEALKLAQAALLYIQELGTENEFLEFYEKFSDTAFKVEVSHEFATRDEADTWLAHGTAKENERVKITGKGFMVVQVPGRFVFMIAPLPEELETDEWKEESE